mmetsp:Transcript_57404/g.151169  ORF Transcript_57404/g.151169 Transcript_57404/m.151169 type:complete len:209 (-) Transcript_57404:653-1279(-)
MSMASRKCWPRRKCFTRSELNGPTDRRLSEFMLWTRAGAPLSAWFGWIGDLVGSIGNWFGSSGGWVDSSASSGADIPKAAALQAKSEMRSVARPVPFMSSTGVWWRIVSVTVLMEYGPPSKHIQMPGSVGFSLNAWLSWSRSPHDQRRTFSPSQPMLSFFIIRRTDSCSGSSDGRRARLSKKPRSSISDPKLCFPGGRFLSCTRRKWE